CSICENKLNETDSLVITDCNNIFHRNCAQERPNMKNISDCHFCHQDSALGNALSRLQIGKEGECSIYSALGNALYLKDLTRKGECSICEDSWNRNDDVVITTCNHTFHRTCAQDRLNKRGRTHCHFCHRKSALGDILFRNTTTTIKDPPEQNANPIKSDKTLGDGFIRVRNNQIKDRLIEDIQNTVLDSTGDTSMISFSNTNELISIIVIDRTNENKDIDLPKPE
ncbi:unnamed protein product, partial [Rotaria sp. Silwood2]